MNKKITITKEIPAKFGLTAEVGSVLEVGQEMAGMLISEGVAVEVTETKEKPKK
ncbi:hypothetical protein [Acinetobacter sp.]|uniref:hypothetical protein n=1 Tax=Acinetobacter sp. TaxID=472 RepID=UPI0025C11E41|nr:hypothetical protein [Acinetobacter sp.]